MHSIHLLLHYMEVSLFKNIQTPEVLEKSSGKPQGIFQTTNLIISKEIKYVGS